MLLTNNIINIITDYVQYEMVNKVLNDISKDNYSNLCSKTINKDNYVVIDNKIYKYKKGKWNFTEKCSIINIIVIEGLYKYILKCKSNESFSNKKYKNICNYVKKLLRNKNKMKIMYKYLLNEYLPKFNYYFIARNKFYFSNGLFDILTKEFREYKKEDYIIDNKIKKYELKYNYDKNIDYENILINKSLISISKKDLQYIKKIFLNILNNKDKLYILPDKLYCLISELINNLNNHFKLFIPSLYHENRNNIILGNIDDLKNVKIIDLTYIDNHYMFDVIINNTTFFVRQLYENERYLNFSNTSKICHEDIRMKEEINKNKRFKDRCIFCNEINYDVGKISIYNNLNKYNELLLILFNYIFH